MCIFFLIELTYFLVCSILFGIAIFKFRDLFGRYNNVSQDTQYCYYEESQDSNIV